MKKREKVTAFDFENAFKALSELDIPKASKKQNNLTERFIRSNVTNALLEDYYDVSDVNELEQAQNGRQEEIAQAKLARIEKIVDINAESPEDILPSYVGKNIIQCPQCMTLFYKDQEDIEISEEDPEVVNVSEVCQHCGNDSGYTLIGKVEAVEEESVDEELPVEEPIEETDVQEEENIDDEDVENVEEPTDSEETEEDSLNLDLPEDEELETVEESLQLNEAFDKDLEQMLDKALINKSNVLVNYSSGSEYQDISSKIKNWAKRNNINIFAIDAKMLDFTHFGGLPIKRSTAILEPEYLNNIKDNTVLWVDEINRALQKHLKDLLTLILEKRTDLQDFKNKILFTIATAQRNEEFVDFDAELDNAIASKFDNIINYNNVSESLNEAVDKDLDDKLKAHNEYIEYLKEMIEKEEESLANAKNDFVKKSIQSRIDALKADLESALPEALKGEVETELPTAEEVELEATENKNEKEEVKESLKEEFLVENGDKLALLRQEKERLETQLKELPEIYKIVLEGEKRYQTADESGKEFLDYISGGDYLKSIKFDLDEFSRKKQNYLRQIKVIDEIINNGGNLKMTQTKTMIDQNGKEIEVKESLNETYYACVEIDGEERRFPFNTREEARNYIDMIQKGEAKEFEGKKIGSTWTEGLKEETKEALTENLNEDSAEKLLKDFANSLDEDLETEEKLAEFEQNLEESADDTEGEESLKTAIDSRFGPIKVSEEDVKVHEEFVDDVSSEEFRAMLNDLIYNESFEEKDDEEISLDDAIAARFEYKDVEEDFEELDECSLNEHISGYLTNVYENVKSFETTNCVFDNNKLMIEGNINFNSGNVKKTNFEFIKEDQVFTGKNTDLCEGLNFTLAYKVENKVIITEGFKYKYTIGENLVEGIIKK